MVDLPDRTGVADAARSAAGRPGPLPRARLGEHVYDELLARLLSHRLEPGQRLTIDALARELGVSQTPIREAMQRLEAGGVVVRTHLAGYRVAPQLTREQFEELVEVRLLLEPAAARWAAQRMDAAAVADLAALATSLQGAAGEPEGTSYAVFAGLDARFHDAVAAGSGNAVVRDCLARMHTHVKLLRLGSGQRVRTEAVAEHQAVVDAVAARDPEAGAAAMLAPVQRSAARFAAAFDD